MAKDADRANRESDRIEEALQKQKQRIEEKREKHSSSVGKRVIRRGITGASDVRVRDFVKVPRVVKRIDKFSFTLGVTGVVLSHHLAITLPELFWAWFTLCITTMLSHRLWSYRRKKWHYFMLDFCYYANALFLINIFVLPNSTALFMVNFCFSNGPLLLALVAWRNSLVFHDLDKVTSVFLHALPSLLSWCWRWHGMRTLMVESIPPDSSDTKSAFFYVPMALYLAWQIAYLTWTEVVAKNKLDQDPDLITSLRWLAKDEKQPMHRMSTRLLRNLRVLGPNEKFDPHSTKTKAIFVTLQLILTLLALLPMPLLYHNKTLHAIVLITAFLMCTWNGASYYIEVFSRRYVKKLSNDTNSAEDEADAGDPDAAPEQAQEQSAEGHWASSQRKQ